MYATLHRKMRKDMYVEDGTYDESIDIDLFGLYEELVHKYGDDGSYGFKDYNDLTDETKDQLVEIVSNFEVEGDTLYSVDEWIDRYGDHHGIEDCYYLFFNTLDFMQKSFLVFLDSFILSYSICINFIIS